MGNSYDVSKQMLESIRYGASSSKRVSPLNEAIEHEGKPIAITDDPKFGSNVLTNQINNFKQVVNGGAKFAKENSENAESNPLVYFPETGNLIFSGSIPCLSDLKFQFSMNDVTGAPYIFVDGLALTDDVMTTLLKLQGYYKNWRDEWLVADDILGQLSKNNKK